MRGGADEGQIIRGLRPLRPPKGASPLQTPTNKTQGGVEGAEPLKPRRVLESSFWIRTPNPY